MDLEECVLITDSALNYLASGCPRLEKLVSCLFIYHRLVQSHQYVSKLGTNKNFFR